MSRARLFLDTSVLIDYLCERKPQYADARKLMLLGCLGEFELWILSPQVLDLLHILSDGGGTELLSQARERLRGVRTFVNVYAVTESDIDRMLISEGEDPRAALLQEAAFVLEADAIITRSERPFASKAVRIMDCAEFFAWYEKAGGVSYDEMVLEPSAG